MLMRTLTATLFFALATLAQAESVITISFEKTPLSAGVGGIITFRGSVTTAHDPSTPADPVYLNSWSITLGGNFAIDDSPSNNLPLTMSADDFTGFLDLFYVTVLAQAPGAPTLHYGSYVLLGGYDPSDQTVLATGNFAVNVTPDPATVWLALAGIGSLGWLRRRQRMGPNRPS
jgi:MYXO-CTERM domain-containing protein